MSMFLGGFHMSMITGRLGADPEPVKDGKGARLSIAVQEFKQGEDGGQRPAITHWFQVVIWGENRADTVCAKLRKGDLVCCECTVTTNKYKPDGAKQEVTGTNFAVQPGQNWWKLAEAPGTSKSADQDRYVDRSESQEPPRRAGRFDHERAYGNPREEEPRRPRPPERSNRTNGRDDRRPPRR